MKRLNRLGIKRLIKRNARLVGVGMVVIVIGLALAISAIAHSSKGAATVRSIVVGPLPNLDNTTTQNINPTNNFKVSANWGINWNYDCIKVNPQPGVFDVTVQDPNGSYSANADSIVTNGVKGSGVQQESQAGTYQLVVNADTDCTWHVQVVNNSGLTTISDAPAPTSSKTAQPQNNGPAKYEAYPQGGSPTTDATVWESDGAAMVVNPADLRLFGEVKNTGGQNGTPQCTIQAHDDSYSYHGTDVVERTSALKPGGVWDWNDDLTITSQGAQYVTQISVSCQ